MQKISYVLTWKIQKEKNYGRNYIVISSQLHNILTRGHFTTYTQTSQIHLTTTIQDVDLKIEKIVKLQMILDFTIQIAYNFICRTGRC